MSNVFQRIFRVTGLEKGYGKPFGLIAILFTSGCYWDRHDTNRMTMFRDKSALFGRELKQGEKPTWPSQEMYWN